jgi:hypothetical protein
MALRIKQYGDVARLRMSSVGSRAVGLDVSAYVVRGVMIDTGFHRVRSALLAAVRAVGVSGVIVTHWHEDHAGNVSLLARQGIPILMRADTDATLRARPTIQLYRRVVWGHPPALTSTIAAFDPAGLRTLGVRSRVLHASEDPYEIVHSLRTVLALQPRRMFDAHRGFVKRPVDAIGAKIEWLSDTLGAIERRVAEGWSDRAIVRRLLGGEEMSAVVSRGDYARRNLVKAVRRKVAGEPAR